MDAQILTIQGAADALGVSVKTLKRYEKAGRIPAPRRMSNGYRVYTSQDVEEMRPVIGDGSGVIEEAS